MIFENTWVFFFSIVYELIHVINILVCLIGIEMRYTYLKCIQMNFGCLKTKIIVFYMFE